MAKSKKVICVVCGREVPVLSKVWMTLDVSHEQPVGVCGECADMKHTLVRFVLNRAVTVAGMERDIGELQERTSRLERRLVEALARVNREIGS